MSKIDYWAECISEAAEECDLTLTRDQLGYLAEAVEGAHENIDLAFPSGPPDPHIGRQNEIAALNRELDKERSKIHCRECDGRGRIISECGPWVSNSQCWKCHGEGRDVTNVQR